MNFKGRNNLLHVASDTRMVELGLRPLGHLVAKVGCPSATLRECISRPTFGAMVFSDLPKAGGKNLKKQKRSNPNTTFKKPTCERAEIKRYRTILSPRFSAGFLGCLLTSAAVSHGGGVSMNIELSREEVKEAVRIFVFGKTGVNVKGKTVEFQIDRVTDLVEGATVNVSSPSQDLPPLGRHTA